MLKSKYFEFSHRYHLLYRSEYYTIPPVKELNQQIDSNGDILVDDFVVGREGYGKVKFYGRTNVAGLNLDEIGECTIQIL